MDLKNLKEEIIRRIEETDDLELLHQIQDVMTNYQSFASEPAVAYGIESDEDIVAYTVDGKPMTRAEYVADINAAEKEFDEGNFYTTDEVKKIVTSWKK